ncbi:hemK methyltransferase family member 1 [Vombatus ursinus]|uniref:hemK methyltransferase family member 1 n=1 Tax=Vombatus ursinus TaxID=29139 RepID=UPI000FFCF3D4|nr:hemK methyltransferase family member 1 [Vombatus ursinus]
MWLWRIKPWGLAPGGLKWKGGLRYPPVLLPLRPVSGCRAPLVTATALVKHWAQLFEERGVPEARESSEYIVAHVLGAKTFQSLLASQRSTCVTDLQRKQIGELCARRLQRMPVQYVIGEWDFQGLTLKMAPPVFIPRPETEVGKLSVAMRPALLGGGELVSIWTHHLPTHVNTYAGDVSVLCPLLIHEHMQWGTHASPYPFPLLPHRFHLENRIQIVRHDITSGVNRKQLLPWGPVDFVVSNPPYIFHRDMEQLAPEILSYEDTESLDGGEDGMRVIREILSQAPMLLKDSGSIFLEVDPRHPELVGNWLQSHPDLALSISATHVDFCGKPRFLHIRKLR